MCRREGLRVWRRRLRRLLGFHSGLLGLMLLLGVMALRIVGLHYPPLLGQITGPPPLLCLYPLLPYGQLNLVEMHYIWIGETLIFN